MTPGAICECGHTIATKLDAKDPGSMERLLNRAAKHAIRATIEETESGKHGDLQYVEKTKGDKRFENPDELV